MKKKECKRVLYIESGDSIESVLSKLASNGVTDFSSCRFEYDYVGCSCDHGDGYCYCPSSYSDFRVEY